MRATGIISRHRLPMGLRDPVVVMLLVAAVFDGISDNWVHALFLGTVGMALAWDAHRRRRQHLIDEVAGADSDLDRGAAVLGEAADNGPTATGAGGALSFTHDGALALDAPSGRSYAHTASSRYWAAVYSAAGIAFAVIVGGLPRYSWPASIAVASLGAAMVARGWSGPAARGTTPVTLDHRGTAVWTSVFVAGALWELAALLLQPSLTIGSDTHPTISVLSDPLLLSHLGRSVALLGWLGFGWFLLKR